MQQRTPRHTNSATRSTGLLLVALLGWMLPAPPSEAAPGTVEAIEVQGLRRMSRVAFLHALDIEVGDPYDLEKLKKRFKALWTVGGGVFADITFEVETGPEGGSVLVVKVRERPVLSSVTFEDNKEVSRTQIEDRLKERDHELKLGKPIDMGAVFFAESDIRDLLSEQGFLSAKVEAQVQQVTETSRSVHFAISPGGKTRIRKINFVGNERFSDRKLRKALELTQQRKWYWPWSRKNLYHQVKWDQDISSVKDLYQNLGYLDIEIRPPVVEVREAKESKNKGAEAESEDQDQPADSGTPEPKIVEEPVVAEAVPMPEDLTPKQQKKLAKKQRKQAEEERKRRQKDNSQKRWVELTVPIVEGPQYTLGEVTVTGNEVFTDRQLRPLVPVREGTLVNSGLIDYGVDQITRLYANKGHLYATVVRRIQRHDEGNVADVEVIIDEDNPYHVGRIEFAGNSQTHDAVLRREMLLDEGQLFRRDDLDVSKIKVSQLGYWVPEEPVIEPQEDDQVLITVPGTEHGRNEIQVGGGFSEFDGAFFSGVYSTRNFLGRGQVLSTAITIGGRSNRYQISFQEPYFLNRPYTLGFSIFRRDIDYGSSLENTSNGFGIVLGKRLGRFSRLNVGYNFESVTSTTFLNTIDDPTRIEQEFNVSSVVPVFSFTTVNNPYRPTRGRALTLSMQISGGPLGGDTSLLKPVLTYTQYKPLNRRLITAFHAQTGWVGDWADGTTGQTSLIGGVPRFQRFWLGGDTQGPRVFETRSVTPLRYVEVDDNGQIVAILDDPRFIPIDQVITSGGQPATIEVGGNRFYLLQSELVVPFNEQAEVAFFVDAGDSLYDDQSWSLDTTRVSAGLELRFHLPIFPVPLRLIYGFPVRDLRGDDTSNFTFSIGKSF